MTMFYQGSLQDGISLAVRDSKGVICFVREDTETSSQWEMEYFGEDEFAQILDVKSVVLRLTAGSQEAGFLTSFCPITKFPAVVVIKNGTLRDYLVPEISKDEFRRRLMTALEDGKPQSQANSASAPQLQSATRTTPPPASVPAAPVANATSPRPSQPAREPEAVSTQQTTQRPQTGVQSEKKAEKSEEPKSDTQSSTTSAEKFQQQKEERIKKLNEAKEQETAKNMEKRKAAAAARAESKAKEAAQAQSKPVRTAPTQYRLQVRLFDGSSVRSSFTPSQTISKDVRPWLDQQMTDETHPYNLKHILTPLPNRTISTAEEAQSLEALGLGPTANLVMVPIQSYTEAYSAAGSLPIRAVSSVYGLVSSATGAVTGMIGSALGYGQPESTSASSESHPANNVPSSTNGGNTRRANRGPVIRTLRDQREEQDDKQLYNGNQLNFQPRNDSDAK